MKDDFDVDRFVAECRKHVQLEQMREDLEQYYRLLKTAMVELINKDYADFVNLSTNLVGMDKALNQLSVPLGQLREEVLSLRSAVNEVIQAIDTQLSKQDDIQKKKVTGQILERIATEFNQLQFHAVQSKGMPLLDKVRPRIAGITAMLQQSLEGLLIQGLQTSNVDIVRHCLRTYATIDKTRDAEALVGQVLVKPYMDQVITEQFVKSSPNGLQLMYAKLLEFVPHHCRLLREVTGGTISSDKADIVPGYDFLVNSVWPEIIKGVEGRIPFLFNPGNPDAFYERYCISMDFVRKFERQCGSQASVKRLRAHASYQSFHNKWNLPVYFQLRYKEIAACLENAITEGLGAAPVGSRYRLQVTEVLWSCVCRCWAEHIYLPPLAHRFWKLTLQLLSRYAAFLTEVQISLLSFSLLFRFQIPEISELIRERLEGIGFKIFALVSDALEDSKSALSGCIPTLSNRMTQHLTERSVRFLKNASEVPRLYRRTNKEVPTRASAYMDNALRPLHQLVTDSTGVVKDSIIQQWLRVTLSDCTHRYFETISDVLSSVKKMEESLKRLKQARKTATTSTAGANTGPSDDSKIRLQLALDVEYLGEQVEP
uniref:Conserved oligomeric Golgi complex subunit 2 n=1 Tax=Astyanax mexicanus TaxID=7994 RepID=A0A8B9LPV6_ASTMX